MPPKIHKKAARQAKHDARLWARAVVDDHGLIALEDFKPKFLCQVRHGPQGGRRRHLGHQTHVDRVWPPGGWKVVLVRPAYTTMTCSEAAA